MLTFLGKRRRFCDGISRRDFLRVGALSVGGLSLADLLRLKAQAASAPHAGQERDHGLPARRAVAPRQYDMKPRGPGRVPRRVPADPHATCRAWNAAS